MLHTGFSKSVFSLLVICSSLTYSADNESSIVYLTEGQNTLVLKVINANPLEIGEMTLEIPASGKYAWLSVRSPKESFFLPSSNFSCPVEVALQLGVSNAPIGASATLPIILKRGRLTISKTEIEIRITANHGSPQDYELLQNYPNPFNSSTEISFALPLASDVSLRIFNVKGEEVRELVHGFKTVGYHAIRWDGKDNNGKDSSAGAYLCQMEVGEFSKSITMLLVR